MKEKLSGQQREPYTAPLLFLTKGNKPACVHQRGVLGLTKGTDMQVYLDQAEPNFLPLGTLNLQMMGLRDQLIPARMSPISRNI